MATDSFRPIPNSTTNITVGASTGTIRLITANDTIQVRVMNDGTATIWYEVGNKGIVASVTTSAPLASGACELVTVKASNGEVYVDAVAAAATGKVYFTPGYGF